MLPALDGLFAATGVVLLVVLTFRVREHPGAWSLVEAPPRTNRFADESILLAVGVYFLTALLAGAILGTDSPSAGARLMSALVTNLVGAATCAAIAARRFDGGIRRMLLASSNTTAVAPVRRTRLIGMIASATVASIGLCPVVALGIVTAIRWVAPSFAFPTHPTLLALRGDAPPALILGLWVSAVVTAPLAEEFFFRGLVQTHLAKVLRSRWRAIGVSSLAFGLVHAPQPHAVLPIALFGAVLGYVYERTGGLAAPLLIHALFNAKSMFWETLGAAGPPGG